MYLSPSYSSKVERCPELIFEQGLSLAWPWYGFLLGSAVLAASCVSFQIAHFRRHVGGVPCGCGSPCMCIILQIFKYYSMINPQKCNDWVIGPCKSCPSLASYHFVIPWLCVGGLLAFTDILLRLY